MPPTNSSRHQISRSFPAGLGLLLAGLVLNFAGEPTAADDWPQWRGPNSTGVSTSEGPLPVEFSPTKNVRWSVREASAAPSTSRPANRSGGASESARAERTLPPRSPATGRSTSPPSPGIVGVLESGPKLNVLARNNMEEPIAATPAIADGRLFIRTRTKLYCIADEAR